MSAITQPKPAAKASKVKAWLEQIEGKIALKTAIAAGLSLILGIAFSQIFDRPEHLVNGLWSVVSAIVVMQAHLGGTYQAAWVRFLGVLVGSIAGGVFVVFLGDDALSLGIGVFSTIIICSMLNIKESFRIASMSAAVIIILVGAKPTESPWLFSLYRFLDSCIGILTAVFVAQVLWPEKAVEKLRQSLIKALAAIDNYYRMAIILEPESQSHAQVAETLYADILERLQKNRAYGEEIEIELRYKGAQRHTWTLLTQQMETIFELVLNLKSAHKDSLLKIFDDSLANQVTQVIDQTDLAFQALQKRIVLAIPDIDLAGLDNALAALNSELQRFRATRTTRMFNFEDVENFFVFFFSLRSIGEAIKKMAEYANELT